MATYPTSKHELRKTYREKRLNMALEEFQSLNEQLLAQVKKLDMNSYRTVHLFLPIEGNREPDTYVVASWLRETHPHIRLALSKTNASTHSMYHMVWNEQTSLAQNRWGIPEPENGTVVAPGEIDAVFVPLLAFDTHGNRVGYGKGFYDRFLAECRPDTVKIGLSLFDAEKVISGTNSHDIRLDYCVTPHHIWRFSITP